MDNFSKGLITAYNRILDAINEIDPELKSNELAAIRLKILLALYSYSIFLAEEIQNDPNSILMNQEMIEQEISKLNETVAGATKNKCKILEMSADYFNIDHIEN